MVKKTTTKKKKQTNTEFKVRKISNGYMVTVWDTVDFVEDTVIYCATRVDVLDKISELVF